jgi:hypothetical protein
MKKKESSHSKKFKIRSSAPKGARHQDGLANWPRRSQYNLNLNLNCKTSHPVPEGNKYRNLALKVRGVKKNTDNKIYSWVLWDSDLRKATLVMPSKNCKLQMRLLIRECAPHQQIPKCLKIIKERGKKLVTCPKWVPDTKADWPTDCRSWYKLWLCKTTPCGGRLEYPHRSSASRKRRKKGNPSARGYIWATLFLGDINTGTRPSRLAESHMRQ